MTGRIQSRDERGAVALVVAVVTSAVLFGLCALVVDLGLARERKQESQVNSDAAALAAATALYRTGGSTGCSISPCFAQAIAAAEAYTARNFPEVTAADWASCSDANSYYVFSGTLPSGTVATQCISFADDANLANSTQPTKVRVLTPVRSVKLGFGGAVGASSVPIQTAARAKLQPGTSRSCGLCLLGSADNEIINGDVIVEGASVHSNGKFVINASGKVEVTTAGGTITTTNGCPQRCYPTATYAPAISDPYTTAVTLPPTELTALGPKSGSPCGTAGSAGPGIYVGAVTLPNSACALQPGLYVIAGSWTAGNNTKLTGNGVTLFFTCATGSTVRACNEPGEEGGFLDMKNGDARLSGMTTGSLAGYVLVYDRNNVSDLSLQGNGDTGYTGTIYAPNTKLSFTGNSCVEIVNGPIIVGELASNGTKACLQLSDAAGADIPEPPGAPNLDQ